MDQTLEGYNQDVFNKSASALARAVAAIESKRQSADSPKK